MENKDLNKTLTQVEPYAVILGGSSGLGLATAKKLAKAGMNICIVHRDRKSNLAEFQQHLEEMKSFGVIVKSFNQDALKEEVREEIISNFPENSINLLLHSIAKGSLKSMATKDNEQLKKEDIEISTHAMGTSWYEWTQSLINNNKFAKDARNIAFTSEGNQKVWPGYGAVSVAKAVLEALMRQMAVEFAPLGIKTNCIQAGTTRTASFEAIPDSEKLAALALIRNPFKKLTTPKDVANVVYLLSLPEAAWINGSILKVDGGESIR